MPDNNVPYAREAEARLLIADPILARVIDAVGPIKLALRRERFAALGRAIIFQQLAGAAARTIHDRFVRLFLDGDFPRRGRFWRPRPKICAGSGSRARRAFISGIWRRTSRTGHSTFIASQR